MNSEHARLSIRLIKNRIKTLAMLVSLMVLCCQSIMAQMEIPNGVLEIAYRQNVQGELSKGVHSVKLVCNQGSCSITTLTVNQCFEGKFSPKSERSSTEEGNLRISTPEEGLLLAEESFDEGMFHYRFEFTTRPPEEWMRKSFGNRRWFHELTGFSGAVVKNSILLKKTISWDLDPLSGNFVEVELDCKKVLLKGLPRNTK